MTQAVVQLTRRRFGETMRRDAWWLQPLGAFVVLSAFLVYATWAAFQNAHYEYGPYLSPFYSPQLFGDSPHAWFRPGAARGCPPFSPALLILPFPAGFRFTCYYYRGAYYKAFWADPPGCTVGEPRTSYRGERTFPLDHPEHPPLLPVLRACSSSFILAHDAWKATLVRRRLRRDALRHRRRHARARPSTSSLLSGYTLGCHSLRHLVGGYLDRSRRPPGAAHGVRLRRAASTAGT